MNVLVTGGNGFLGSWLVRALVARGDQVRVLHRKSSDLTALKNTPYESVIGDVTDLPSLIKAAQNQEAVFHVAALISYAVKDYEVMEQINVGGTANVVEACLQAKVKRLVFTSSVVTVGATLDGHLLNEESAFTLQDYKMGYYDTKRAAEALIRVAVRERGLDAVIVNPGIMFGAGDATKDSRKTHIKVAQGKMKFYPMGGCNILHVADAVEGHLKALEKGRSGERYILGGDNVKIEELFKMLALCGGNKPPPIGAPNFILRAIFKFGRNLPVPADSLFISTLFHWYDCAKARRELDFRTRPAIEGVRESIEWCKKNGYLN